MKADLDTICAAALLALFVIRLVRFNRADITTPPEAARQLEVEPEEMKEETGRRAL
jgi:hypothetical protein